jgi:uncharacterized protein
LLAVALWQTTPSGGAIAKFVPPVPTPASFISDRRSVLDDAAHRELDARITAFQQAGLGDIAVAILPSIGSYAPQQVAVEVYRTWKVGSVAPIGNAHRNIGVLLLIVPKELAPDNKGQCFILTGLGSEGIITDAQAGAMCRDSIIPHLREKDYRAAIGAGINAIEARMRTETALTTTPGPTPQPVATDHGAGEPLLGLAIAISGILVLILGIVSGRRYARNRQRSCARCGRKMRRLDEQDDNARLDRGQRVEEMIKSIDYDVWVCDCGESKLIPYRNWFSRYGECRECHRRTAKSTYTVLVPATTASTGLAEKRYRCESCQAKWDEKVILPRVTESASSSSSGGGGGGSSFGGSGATSGGGGGSSY